MILRFLPSWTKRSVHAGSPTCLGHGDLLAVIIARGQFVRCSEAWLGTAGLHWQTPVDAGGCRWTPVDAGGRRWTPVDVGGRLWTPVAAGVNERESKFACGKEEKKKINICIILNIYNQRDACRVEGRNKTKRTRKIRRKVVHKNKKKGGEEKKPSLKDSNHAITYKKDKSPFYYLPEKTDWWLRAFDAFAPWSLGDGLSGEFSINADLYLCVCSSGRY